MKTLINRCSQLGLVELRLASWRGAGVWWCAKDRRDEKKFIIESQDKRPRKAKTAQSTIR